MVGMHALQILYRLTTHQEYRPIVLVSARAQQIMKESENADYVPYDLVR